MATFETEMQQQRDRARQARQNSQSMQVQSEVLKKITTESKFVGYDVMDRATTITDIIHNGELMMLQKLAKLFISFLKKHHFML